MTDRELLEKAAKAAGLKLDVSGMNGGAKGQGFDCMDNAVLDWHNSKFWNPLTNDGDAFRLAVKLNLDIRFSWYDDLTAVFVGGTWDNAPEGVHELFERNVTDATRRAIVRAAAAVGESHE